VRLDGGSGGAVSSAASSSVVCCCVLYSFGVVVVRRGEWDCMVLAFMHTWSKWPWCMATEAGGYFLTAADVRPGRVLKWPASIAVHHMERVG
jgi:hypothetical protein